MKYRLLIIISLILIFNFSIRAQQTSDSVILKNRKSAKKKAEMVVLNDEYLSQAMPKNTYELVFDFMMTNSPDKANQLPQFIENRTGSSINDKAILNRIGFKQVSQRIDANWGIALLKLNVDLFPKDGNLWDSLGEGYYLLNDKDNAIESYEKALEFEPAANCYWCENTTKRLKELLDK